MSTSPEINELYAAEEAGRVAAMESDPVRIFFKPMHERSEHIFSCTHLLLSLLLEVKLFALTSFMTRKIECGTSSETQGRQEIWMVYIAHGHEKSLLVLILL